MIIGRRKRSRLFSNWLWVFCIFARSASRGATIVRLPLLNVIAAYGGIVGARAGW
jgi:hypothetical protein